MRKCDFCDNRYPLRPCCCAFQLGDKVRIINDGHTIWGGSVGTIAGKDDSSEEWLILLDGGQGIVVGEPRARLEKVFPAPAPKAREIDLSPTSNASAFLAKAFGW